MKSFIFGLAFFAFISCGTPSTGNSIPTDSIMNSGQPTPDAKKLDSIPKNNDSTANRLDP
jgi:hypothetical protein